MPIGNRTAGETGLKILGTLEHGAQGHESTVTPAPNANAFAINKRQRFQLCCSIALIGQFLRTQVKANGLLEKMSPACGTPIVHRKNQESFLRHQLMP